jgi:hypothetical protein
MSLSRDVGSIFFLVSHVFKPLYLERIELTRITIGISICIELNTSRLMPNLDARNTIEVMVIQLEREISAWHGSICVTCTIPLVLTQLNSKCSSECIIVLRTRYKHLD